MKNLCRDCKHAAHPEWAILLPGFKICTSPLLDETKTVGRLDVQRAVSSDYTCGPEGKWWEAKDE